MKNLKEPKNHEEQLAILEERGCKAHNKDNALIILSQINYYKLSAYLLPFKNDDETFTNINFEKLYKIYLFDRELRNILLEIIEPIETDLKTKLAYFHSHEYGAEGYLDQNNFNKKHNHNKFINGISLLKKQQESLLFVKHHNDNYSSRFPMWVIIELFSFANTSYFYSDLKTKDKKKIANLYDVHYNELGSWLRCLTILRNTCAHGGRLYYHIFPTIPKGFSEEFYNRQLWPLFLVLKKLYPLKNDWDSRILPKFDKLIKKYSNYIDLNHIGMYDNYLYALKNS